MTKVDVAIDRSQSSYGFCPWSLEDKVTEPTKELGNIPLLVIGAGGIGSELLKCLVLCGFYNITVLDLDTVDITNLNRQFFFTDEHVGKSKAEVLAAAVSELVPFTKAKLFNQNGSNYCIPKIEGRIANICESSFFTVSFIRKFKIVLSALDNQTARRHLNRLCLASNTPLIEAGSTGYSGQVMPIIKGHTLCYECEPKPKAKHIPICTLRQRPERAEHCIAWGKMIYELLFGVDTSENVLTDLNEQLNKIIDNAEATEDEKSSQDLANRMLEELFSKQIKDLLYLTDLGSVGPKKPRILLTCESIKAKPEKEGKRNDYDDAITQQDVPSVEACQSFFIKSFVKLLSRKRLLQKGVRHETGNNKETVVNSRVSFDKDDEISMDFVAAAANLRMYNFNIPLKSRWDAEAIAGALVPAIASTNATVAALQVCQLFHLLKWMKQDSILEKKNGNQEKKFSK